MCRDNLKLFSHLSLQEFFVLTLLWPCCMFKITEKKKNTSAGRQKNELNSLLKVPILTFLIFVFSMFKIFSIIFFFAVSWGKGIVLFPKIFLL